LGLSVLVSSNALGRFAHTPQFKQRAGVNSDSVNHRFSTGAENVARRIFPDKKMTRQKLPDGENFAGLGGQLLPLFIKEAGKNCWSRAKNSVLMSLKIKA